MQSSSDCARRAAPLAMVVALVLAACSEQPASPDLPSDPAIAASASAPPALVQVSGGAAHTCGITAAGRAWCWGLGDNGQLGTGDNAIRMVPTPVLGNLVFRQISAGGGHTCGVTTDHHIWCWGANFNGELGDGTMVRRFSPVQVASTLQFQTVSAGRQFGSHTCALTTAGAAYCWGFGGDGELGDGSHTTRTHPVAVVGSRIWREISAGYSHTCGLTESRVVRCWGSDERGQLGDDTERRRHLVPRPVAGGLAFEQISTGVNRSCGVTTDHRAFCWGAGDVGQIGDGKRLDRYVPTAVAGGHSFDRISANGVNHTCAETTADAVYCWGFNGSGEVGDGTMAPRTRPVPVATSLRFAQLTTGGGHTCAVTAAAAAYCWGSNEFGQLGDGHIRVSRSTPGPVAGGG